MGFYFELHPTRSGVFSEVRAPTVFWTLYGLLGFSLTCMGAAAFGVFSDLVRSGDWFDRALIYGFGLTVILYGLVGIRLGFLRKFIRTSEYYIQWGHRMGTWQVTSRRLERTKLRAFEIVHSHPGANTAPTLHADTQYFIQGHYRLIAKDAHDRTWTLDRATEREALIPLWQNLERWRVS